MNYKSPEEFISAIDTALVIGDFNLARQLAFQAVEHYPEREKIKKYAYILAPPMVIVGKPSPETRKMDREWLRENHFKYRNRWVALHQGKLIAEAPERTELAYLVREKEDVVIISIG